MSSGFESLAPPRTPAKPGSGPTPEALLKALSLSVRRRVEGLISGEHYSALLGEGTELAQLRPYEVGDDVRKIDWNATARTGEPHVRANVAEKALTAWIALDVSPSMTFGTAQRRKADVAEGVVLAFGHLTTRGGGRVGLLTFGGSNPRTLPPRGGRVGMLGVLAHARREPAASEVGATSLGEAFRRIFRLARRRGLVVVVSDFRGPRDWWGPIVELVGRHEVIAVEIRDPREQELPDVGDLFLVDPETGRQLRVNTASRRLRERFASEAKKEREELARELARAGVGHLVLSTDSDWLRELARFLLLGKARKRGPR